VGCSPTEGGRGPTEYGRVAISVRMGSDISMRFIDWARIEVVLRQSDTSLQNLCRPVKGVEPSQDINDAMEYTSGYGTD
jgi:hypothetical protein